MPRYQWTQGTIAQIESITNAPGKVEIILRPQKDADAAALTALRQSLGESGCTNYVDADAQGERLIIPVIKDEKALLAQLTKGGWIQGEPTITQTSEDKEIRQDSTREKIQKNALLLSALFYDLGNVSCMVSGYMRGKHNRDGKFTASDLSEMGVGAAFSVGDVLLTAFGKEDKKDPLLAFTEELQGYLKAHSIEIPQGVGATPQAIHNSGFFAGAHDFLKHNVTSIKCLSETAGGLFMIKAALKKDNFNMGKMAAGMMLTTGWLSTFVLDKPHAPPYAFKPRVDAGDQNTGEKMTEWFKENPRGRIAGPLSMGNNISNIIGAGFEARRYRADLAGARASGNAADIAHHSRKQYDYGWNVLTACSFMVANGLFGMSGTKHSDEHVADTKTFTHDVLAVAANMLCSVPPEAKRAAVEGAADYITNIKDVSLRKEEAVEMINARIEHLKHSPFLNGAAQGRA